VATHWYCGGPPGTTGANCTYVYCDTNGYCQANACSDCTQSNCSDCSCK
jgi:hypothetical protein